jgi:hypothetical protein
MTSRLEAITSERCLLSFFFLKSVDIIFFRDIDYDKSEVCLHLAALALKGELNVDRKGA